jgi:hypothetical protein
LEKAEMEPDLKYPIGKFEKPHPPTGDQRKHTIEGIAGAPEHLRAAVKGLTEQQLDTPYRPGGWTVRQVVHHLADSHMNAYVRFRLGLTEVEPVVKPYDEKLWAELPDARTAPIEPSLAIMDAIHGRWVALMHETREIDYTRGIKHPERGLMTLDEQLAMYEWHARHHIAHITGLRKRMNW